MRGCSGHLATSNIVLSKITRHLVESFRYPCRAEARHLDDDPHPCTQIALGRVQVHRNSATHRPIWRTVAGVKSAIFQPAAVGTVPRRLVSTSLTMFALNNCNCSWPVATTVW
jgi:hypothetical protein